jgi:hypothetical protein
LLRRFGAVSITGSYDEQNSASGKRDMAQSLPNARRPARSSGDRSLGGSEAFRLALCRIKPGDQFFWSWRALVMPLASAATLLRQFG